MPAKPRGAVGEFTRSVAAILRSRLAFHDWTQAQLAAKTSVSQSHLSQILGGNSHIYLDQLDELCHALGLNTGDVVAEAWKARRPKGLGFADPDRLIQKLDQSKPPDEDESAGSDVA